MLNKNFNMVLNSLTFHNSQATLKTISGTDGSFSQSAFMPNSSWKGGADFQTSDGLALVISTETFNEDVDNFALPTCFTDYSDVQLAKADASNEVALCYTRIITPNSDVVIKSIALVVNWSQSSGVFALLGFENLAEPVQLTAGEQHTFTFTIKV